MTYSTEDSITPTAAARWATARPERLGQIMSAAARHLHAFAKEVELTSEEWMAGIEFLTAVGKISDEKRQEMILLSDVLGLSMLVVMMNGRLPTGATPNTVLGPFHIDASPELPMGADLSVQAVGPAVYVRGKVKDLQGRPVGGALLDLWQCDSEGHYESQLEGAQDYLRAIFRTGAAGEYSVKTVLPLGYTIPMDGPVGDLMRRTAISEYRPAHIHFIVQADGYAPIVTHLFPEGTDYLDTDVVFGTVGELVTPFVVHPPGPTPDGGTSAEPFYTVDFDFVLSGRPAA